MKQPRYKFLANAKTEDNKKIRLSDGRLLRMYEDIFLQHLFCTPNWKCTFQHYSVIMQSKITKKRNVELLIPPIRKKRDVMFTCFDTDMHKVKLSTNNLFISLSFTVV